MDILPKCLLINDLIMLLYIVFYLYFCFYKGNFFHGKEAIFFRGSYPQFQVCGAGRSSVTVCVIVAGGLLGLSTFEWIAVILCIGAVLAAEGVNSAIEALCDKVSPEYDEAIKHTKDLAAGAVLILAVMSVIVGLLIFVPKILSLFH